MTTKRNQVRIAIAVIRSHLAKNPGSVFRIGNPHTTLPDWSDPGDPWIARISQTNSENETWSKIETWDPKHSYIASGETKADAIIRLAEAIATDALPAAALYVIMDWLREHEATSLELTSPSSTDKVPQWNALIKVPVVLVADQYGNDESDALVNLAADVTRLPADWTEC